jgi:DNA-binding transcriptional regulator GbsR (MarR family)
MYNHHGLKGAPRIVYEDLARLLLTGQPVTISRLTDETGYTRKTISNAIGELIERGLIDQTHENGHGAGYALCSGTIWRVEELMRALVQALAKAAQMSPEERSARLAMAFAADRIYSKAQRLKKLAHQSEDGFQDKAMTFIEENEALKLMKVWPLEEASAIEDRLEELLEEGRG